MSLIFMIFSETNCKSELMQDFWEEAALSSLFGNYQFSLGKLWLDMQKIWYFATLAALSGLFGNCQRTFAPFVWDGTSEGWSCGMIWKTAAISTRFQHPLNPATPVWDRHPPFSWLLKYKNTKTQIHKCTNTQIHKCKYSNMIPISSVTPFSNNPPPLTLLPTPNPPLFLFPSCETQILSPKTLSGVFNGKHPRNLGHCQPLTGEVCALWHSGHPVTNTHSKQLLFRSFHTVFIFILI